MRRVLVVCLSVACTFWSSQPAPPSPPSEPVPTLILALSDFRSAPEEGVVLQPARALLLRLGRDRIWPVEIRDPASNAYHQAEPWRDGLLTIGAEGARIVHWRDGLAGWQPTVLWAPQFGGAHDRIRDLARGDLRGTGVESLVVATHDQGIVAVGEPQGDAWRWTELGRRPRTFIHEVELGDLDGDGALEIYATPSEPNRSTGNSQPGGVERWVQVDGGWRREEIARWDATHAKEILVADLGDGPWLFAIKEGQIGPGGALEVPAQVVRLVPGDDGWTEELVATLLGERQSRFLLAGDLVGDGEVSLVATGMKTGVWRIDRGPEGFVAAQVDAGSGGFEQAAHLADLDGDGQLELYVMNERPGQPRSLNRYTWGGDGRMSRDTLFTVEGQGMTWDLASGTF